MSKHSESLQQELSCLSRARWAPSGLICIARRIKQQSGENRLQVYHFDHICVFTDQENTWLPFPPYLSESGILMKCLKQCDHLICLGTKLPE